MSQSVPPLKKSAQLFCGVKRLSPITGCSSSRRFHHSFATPSQLVALPEKESWLNLRDASVSWSFFFIYLGIHNVATFTIYVSTIWKRKREKVFFFQWKCTDMFYLEDIMPTRFEFSYLMLQRWVVGVLGGSWITRTWSIYNDCFRVSKVYKCPWFHLPDGSALSRVVQCPFHCPKFIFPDVRLVSPARIGFHGLRTST